MCPCTCAKSRAKLRERVEEGAGRPSVVTRSRNRRLGGAGARQPRGGSAEPIEELAARAGFRAHEWLVGSKGAVNAVMARAKKAGAAITDAARDRFWGDMPATFKIPTGTFGSGRESDVVPLPLPGRLLSPRHGGLWLRPRRMRGSMSTTTKAGRTGRRASQEEKPTKELSVRSFATASAWSAGKRASTTTHGGFRSSPPADREAPGPRSIARKPWHSSLGAR